MGNNVNYATIFGNELAQKYSRELLTSGLTTCGVNFVGGNTVKIPFLSLKGYGNHSRAGGFNRQAVANQNLTRVLTHDRNVEFFVDSMDVDETNQALSAANITNTFDSEFAIPETDAYRISKICGEFSELGGEIVSVADTAEALLLQFDEFMQQLDDAEAPGEGRVLYVIPRVYKLLKQGAGSQRFMEFNGEMDRTVRSLDGVKVIVVPESRMRTAYDFADGFEPLGSAGTVGMMLVHPKSVVAVVKHSYIKLWAPGTHTVGDGYLYQNRQYGDLFVNEQRIEGIAIAMM